MIDVKNVVIDKKANMVLISGVDIDEAWKESKEDVPCKDVCYKFDISACERIKVAGENIGINLYDFIIVGNGRYISFCEEGMLKDKK